MFLLQTIFSHELGNSTRFDADIESLNEEGHKLIDKFLMFILFINYLESFIYLD